ncbi:Conserved_hypothetical protein [Hexamita inflata]|uniref:HNH homing endonuclease n=1 Tax=Hexamita inflata TaxID=28002 RepID=A0AA86RD56_9EUKA|nr:Conserved hypothetical protein [Hexamita inflata]
MNFRIIPSFENYIISEDGQVYNTLTKKYISQHLTKDKYLQCNLRKNSKGYQFKIHRLVAFAFIGPIPENYEVDHNDQNTFNNHYTNLRYVTRQDNCRNRKTQFGYEMNFTEDISEECIQFKQYNQHEFEHIYLNPYTFEMYSKNGNHYRIVEQRIKSDTKQTIYCLTNIQGKRVNVFLNVLKNMYK